MTKSLYVRDYSQYGHYNLVPYEQYDWSGRWKLVTKDNRTTMLLEKVTLFGLKAKWVSEYDLEWIEDEPETVEVIYECK